MSHPDITKGMDLTDEQRATYEVFRTRLRVIDDQYNAISEELDERTGAGLLDAELRSLLEFELSHLRDDVDLLVDALGKPG